MEEKRGDYWNVAEKQVEIESGLRVLQCRLCARVWYVYHDDTKERVGELIDWSLTDSFVPVFLSCLVLRSSVDACCVSVIACNG